ncbi:hypothetical protein GCM10007385_13140 [Tateyamaria omphalii]|nr:hypothetical protein GCM10007385_13140 [Tateyamaria omphalii]
MSLGRPILCSLLALGAFAAACTQPAPEVVPNAAGRGPLAIPQNGAALRGLAENRTFHFSFGQRGVQLEYYAASGDAHLWLQEEAETIVGQWKIVETSERDEPRVCFNYPSSSLFTSGQRSDDNWECHRQSDLQQHVIAIVEGDPFELSSGVPPIVIPKDARWSTSRVVAATPQREAVDYVYLYKR